MQKIAETTGEEAQRTIVAKLERLIESCKAGNIHQLVLLCDEQVEGLRMSTFLCESDEHACAFLDKSIAALNEKLARDFDQAVDREVH